MNNSLLTDPHQKKLLKRWEKILESGTPIADQNVKTNVALMLENTMQYFKLHGMLNEAGVAQADIVGTKQPDATVLTGKTGYGAFADNSYGDFYLPNVVFPMLRRIMPDLLANDLVAVQPLHGPVGFALAFRPTYNDKRGIAADGTKAITADNEIGYNPVDTMHTGIEGGLTAVNGDVISGDLTANSFLSAYSNDARWFGQGAKIGEFDEFMDLADYPKVSFNLMKSTVEARTRKLAAHWSPELAEDMQIMHGIDVEREMVNTLTYEVGAEIDRQIVTDMVKAAIVGGSTSTWTPVSADGLDQMGRAATLMMQIAMEAQQIAIRTKRGNANFLITTPRICAMLQMMGMNKFTSFKNGANMPSVPDTGVGALSKIGLINDDSMLLIRDAHVQAADSDYVLMGYKGKQAGDSGIIYCPYVPLQLSKVMQPGSFTPSIGARTRYGLMNNPWDAKNYYAFMKITDMTTPYHWSDSRNFIGKLSAIKTNGVNAGNPVMPLA